MKPLCAGISMVFYHNILSKCQPSDKVEILVRKRLQIEDKCGRWDVIFDYWFGIESELTPLHRLHFDEFLIGTTILFVR